jgi:proteic killer suppression protein
MLRSFRNKALADLWSTGQASKIDKKLHSRIMRRLDALEAAVRPEGMNLPGFDFHSLRGFNPTRYTVHVNGPWRITFAFDGADAIQVDLENYH